MSPHAYKHHPWTHERKESGPVTQVADQAAGGVNARIALAITKAVGSMWCAYAFALFDLISLPEAIRGGPATIVSWVAQTFLQLVLLSIIMVGQNVQAAAADKQSLATYNDASAGLHEILAAQEHLAAQDKLIEETQRKILAALAVLADAGPRPRKAPGGRKDGL
jgi:hypothetical protein